MAKKCLRDTMIQLPSEHLLPEVGAQAKREANRDLWHTVARAATGHAQRTGVILLV